MGQGLALHQPSFSPDGVLFVNFLLEALFQAQLLVSKLFVAVIL